MHYHAEVWVPEPKALFGSSFKENIEKAVEVSMTPYQQNGDGWWDWYQIGGRWTGIHAPDYDPNTDPENIENGSVKWPTLWVHFPSDIMKVEELPELLNCFTLVIKNQVEQEKAWNGEDFVATGFNGLVAPKLKELGITDGYLVTVDYHS